MHLDVPSTRAFGLGNVDEGLVVDAHVMMDGALDRRPAAPIAVNDDLFDDKRRDLAAAAVPADDGVVLQPSQKDADVHGRHVSDDAPTVPSGTRRERVSPHFGFL